MTTGSDVQMSPVIRVYRGGGLHFDADTDADTDADADANDATFHRGSIFRRPILLPGPLMSTCHPPKPIFQLVTKYLH